jgi:UDP-GlcNAc:undecaprenyl-phosphate GlcNAc-1-phosphate transferase
MFAVGFWDDLKPLGAKRKLLAQILIALSVYYFGVGIQSFKIPLTEHVVDLGGWGVLITVCWLVAMTNLINLIDGVDGLAGGICLMLMILLAFVGHQNGHFELLSSGMVGALLAFLWYNFPPARIYLGDGGAYDAMFAVVLTVSLLGFAADRFYLTLVRRVLAWRE